MEHFRAIWNQGARSLDHLTAFKVAGPAVEFIGVREAGGARRTALVRAECEEDVRLVLSAIAPDVVSVEPVHVREWNAQIVQEPLGIAFPALL